MNIQVVSVHNSDNTPRPARYIMDSSGTEPGKQCDHIHKAQRVTVSLQGLTSGQVYYCKAAASSNNTASCAGPVVGGVKGYITFVASLPSTPFPTASTIPLIQAVSFLNSDYMYTLRQLEIYWIHYRKQCDHIHSPTNSVIQNISFLSYSNSISCSFLNNQSFYCVVCCSTDHTVPPVSSVYNISTNRGAEVTVSLKGLTSGQVYYCKAAASRNNTANCASPVVGGVKGYIIFVASLPSITFPTTSNLASIGTHAIIGITIGISFVVFFSLGVLVSTCIGCMVKTRSKVTLYHPAMKPSAYEMIENSQKTMTAPEVEPNSAYETAKKITATEVEPNPAYGTAKKITATEVEPNPAYETAKKITATEVEPNPAYGTAKKITATEVEPNPAYGTAKAIEVEPNSAYGTAKAIEVEPNSAYGTAKKITATEVKPNSTYSRTAKAIEAEPNSAYGTVKKTTATEVEPNSAKATKMEPNSYLMYGTVI
eukprot:Em0001g2271a